MVKGHGKKVRADKLNLAWAVANLMNASGNMKKHVTLYELIDEVVPQRQIKTNIKEDAAALIRRFGG